MAYVLVNPTVGVAYAHGRNGERGVAFVPRTD